MAGFNFTLVDPSDPASTFALDGQDDTTDGAQEYEICRFKNKSDKLLVLKKGDFPPEEAPSKLATLQHYPPVLRITALHESVFVIPGYLGTSSPNCSKQAMLEMSIGPPNKFCRSTTSLLRPGDTIRIGNAKLRVDVGLADTDVQVGSSIPIAEQEQTTDDIESMGEAVNNSIIEVNRSMRAQDSFSETTQSSKRPIVAETPASRRKNRVAAAFNAAFNESSQLPEAVQEQLQFSVDSRDATPAVAEEEQGQSQELLGCATVKRNVSPIPRDTASDRGSSGEPRVGNSTEPEEPFATAQSETDYVSLKDEESAAQQGMDGAEDEKVSTAGLDDETESEEEDTIHFETLKDVHKTTPEPANSAPTKGKKRKSDGDAEVSTSKKRKSPTPEEDLDRLEEGSIIVLQQDGVDAGSAGSPSPGPDAGPSGSAKVERSHPSETNESHASGSQAPASSLRSAKSSQSSGVNSESLKAPRMIFSNSTIPQKSSIMKFLSKQGARQVDTATAKGFDMLVVGTGELKRTSKLLTAIALGKPVVTDDWVLQSSKEGKLLDLLDFTPKDIPLEKEWGFDLGEAMGHARRDLLKGKTLFVTPALKSEYGSGYGNIVNLAQLAGAKRVMSKPARDAIQASAKERADTIIVALEKDDKDAQVLMEHERQCYTKDIISVSLLRGRLDLDDEKLKIAAREPKPRGKTGKKVR